MKTYYTIYQVTNQVNGKTYIGAHKTKNLNDGYMGSGKYVNRAISKHGIDKFTKEILFIFNSAAEMYEKEGELVNEEFITEANTYNLKIGGFGGFDYINQNPEMQNNRTPESISKGGQTTWTKHKKQIKTRLKENNKNLWKFHYSKMKELSKIGVAAMSSPAAVAKKKQTFAKISHQQGIRNSQFGTMWITDGIVNKKIKKTTPMPTGFRKGRVLKPHQTKRIIEK